METIQLISLIGIIIFYAAYIIHLTFIYDYSKNNESTKKSSTKKSSTKKSSNESTESILYGKVPMYTFIVIIFIFTLLLSYNLWFSNVYLCVWLLTGIISLMTAHIAYFQNCNECKKEITDISKKSISSFILLFLAGFMVSNINEYIMNCTNKSKSLLCCKSFVYLCTFLIYVFTIVIDIVFKFKPEWRFHTDYYDSKFSIVPIIIQAIWVFFILFVLDGYKYSRTPGQMLQEKLTKSQVMVGGTVNTISKYATYLTVAYIMFQYFIYIQTTKTCTQWNDDDSWKLNLIRTINYNSVGSTIIILCLIMSFTDC